MKKKVFLIAAIVAMAALGTFLVSGCGDDRSVWWYQQHLDTVQQQLIALKSQLLKYKEAHGHYPTNDEGLAALDNFPSRFPDVIVVKIPGYRLCSWDPRNYASIKQELTAYKHQKGHFPANAEELSSATTDVSAKSKLGDDDILTSFQTTSGELAIGPEGDLFFVSPAGVLTFWMTPYVYENRQGFPAVKFDDSPANADAKRRYSIQVDDGVFVYSLGAREYAQKRDSAWWDYNWPRFAGGGLLVAALILLVWLIRISWRMGLVGAVALVVGGGAGWCLSEVRYVTCYIMSPAFSHRTPEMVSQQRELLDKYHARGILGDQAYQKAVAALEEKPTSQPH